MARGAMIAAACLGVLALAVFLLGPDDKITGVADSGASEATGTVGTTSVSTPRPTDNEPVSAPASAAQAPSQQPQHGAVGLTGLPPNPTIQEGERVELSADGLAAGTSVALLVDGTRVDSGPAPGPLTWIATPGRHLLSVTVVDTGVVSDPVTVDVTPTQVVQLRPVSAVASNERSPVPKLRCGGSNSFEAPLLIDGDVNTGWGASEGDGRGQQVTIDFGQQVTISRLGLSPGYLRVARRASNDCRSTLAFEYNRFVEQVEYRFDDGSSVIQHFIREATIQEMSIAPVSTRMVTIVIVSTDRQIEDDDTVLSEAVFYGSTP